MIEYIGSENYKFYHNLNEALKKWLPKEYQRKWSAVLSEEMLHANSRCPIVGGEDYWNLGSIDKKIELSFEEIIRYKTHCLDCIRSYLPGGFIYNWFSRIYCSLVKIAKLYNDNDINKAYYELLNFKFTEYLGYNEQLEIYNKLKYFDKNSDIYSRYIWYIKGDELIYNDEYDYSRSVILKNGFVLLFLDERRDEKVYILGEGKKSEKMEIFKVLYEDEKDNFSSENIYLLLSIADSL